MNDINHLTITGNLTADARLHQGQKASVLAFSIASNSGYFDRQTSQWVERADFINVSIFGKAAEALAGKLVKGAKVLIEGRLRYNTWTAEDGSTRHSLDIVAQNIRSFAAKRSETHAQAAPNEPDVVVEEIGTDGPLTSADIDIVPTDVPF